MTTPFAGQRLDHRDNVTRGTGAIVLRVTNGYGFCEHASIVNAKAEAARLVEKLGGRYVIYVPVAIVEPAPKVLTTDLVDADRQRELDDMLDEPLPF